MSSRSLLAISLSAALALSFSPLAFSADSNGSADTLLKIHQLRLAAQKSLGDLYMYNGMEGDQHYAQLIEKSTQDGDNLIKQLDSMPGEGSKALAGKLTQQWSSYESELKSLANTLKTQGFTDLQPMADLATQNQQFLDLSRELYNKIQQESASTVPPLTQLSREQSMLMQSISVDYAARSASVGGSFIGNAGDSASIDEQANQFASGLSKLEQAPQNTPEIRQTLTAINTKWRYIEKSLKNYNEKTVPFLVTKNADRIIEELETVSTQYAEKKL